MVYLSAENIKKSLGEKVICNDINLYINSGDKIALVANNGTGKSTLLRMLVGLEPIDQGKLYINKDIKVGFLDQDPKFKESHTILESVLDSSSEIITAVRNYEHALLHPEDSENYQKAFDEMDRLSAWDYEAQIKDILNELKIKDLERKVSLLSGGEKKRLALAKVLIDEPDLLILDEPTNHLDLEMIEWLEKYLSTNKLALLMVSHDRYFLDRITDKILELSHGNIYEHKGNYEYFLEKKHERENIDLATFQKTKQVLKKEVEWVSKMPQGRGTKSKGRTEKYYSQKSENDEQKREINKNKSLKIDIKHRAIGSKIMSLFNLTKSYGEKVILNKFNFEFRLNERIAIVGGNGVGKTTFLNMLMGSEQPDSGNIVVGQTVTFGYFSQNGMDIDENQTVLSAVKSHAEMISISKDIKLSASQFLERFLFPKNVQSTLISNLSGGEKKRLSLLILLLKNPNFLILDEPTNDLDLTTLEVFEEFLLNYKGCLIIVSHDRYFIDKLADRLLVFEGNGKIFDMSGNYSDYLGLKNIKVNSKKEIIPVKITQPVNDNKKLLSKLEKEIVDLEKKKILLSDKLNQQNVDMEKVLKISKEIGELSKIVDQKTDEWMRLIN